MEGENTTELIGDAVSGADSGMWQLTNQRILGSSQTEGHWAD